MRALALWCLSLALVVALAYADDFELVGNATTISDPDGVLNYRFVSTNMSMVERSMWFRSLRSEAPPEATYPEIDTLGGFVSFKSLPMAFFGYWNFNASFNPPEIKLSLLTEAMATGFTTLIERDALGNVVRSLALAQSTSNTSAGVDWEVEYGSSSLLSWLNMSTRVRIAPNNCFKVEIIWFLSSVMGQLDIGSTDISPRTIESVIRISHYPYLNASNTLSLRVVCAYDTLDSQQNLGNITSGTGLNQLYFRLGATYQTPMAPYQKNGPEFNATISNWQSSAGLRTAISNSFVGGLLNERFGGTWDVQIADVTFRPGVPHIIYDPTTGSSFSISSPSSLNNPDEDPETGPSSGSGASTGKLASLSLLMALMALMALLF